MTQDHIKDLREKAEAATPGPWILNEFRHPGDIYATPDHQIARCFADKKWDAPNGKFYTDALQGAHAKTNATREITANATYIAAANPETILALLTLNDRLVEALQKSTAFVDRLLLIGAWDRQTAEDISMDSEEVLQYVEEFKKTGEIK